MHATPKTVPFSTAFARLLSVMGFESFAFCWLGFAPMTQLRTGACALSKICSEAKSEGKRESICGGEEGSATNTNGWVLGAVTAMLHQVRIHPPLLEYMCEQGTQLFQILCLPFRAPVAAVSLLSLQRLWWWCHVSGKVKRLLNLLTLLHTQDVMEVS